MFASPDVHGTTNALFEGVSNILKKEKTGKNKLV